MEGEGEVKVLGGMEWEVGSGRFVKSYGGWCRVRAREKGGWVGAARLRYGEGGKEC